MGAKVTDVEYERRLDGDKKRVVATFDVESSDSVSVTSLIDAIESVPGVRRVRIRHHLQGQACEHGGIVCCRGGRAARYPAGMATIPCPSCGHLVDIKSKRCPKCGGPMTLLRLVIARQPALALAIAIAGVGFLASCCWSFTHP